ncbi:MAG TPA: hypothetical protein VE963_22545 [Reyranella sp.]|nr:hypothetical protein [Reyranella sp.]
MAPSVNAIAPNPTPMAFGSPEVGVTGTNGAAGASANGVASPGTSGAPGVSGGVGAVGAPSGQAVACRTLSADGKTCLEPYYSIEAIYFTRGRYASATDCLNAASSMRLPLDLCR